MSENIVEYGSFTVEAAEESFAELSRSGESKWMKLQVGRNVVRFLPPPVGMKLPFVLVRQHFFNLPSLPKPIVFNCPRAMARRRCPACEKAQQLSSTGSQGDYERSKVYWHKLRVFANVIDRQNESDGPKILGFGKTIFEDLLTLRRDQDVGVDFTDPINGYDISINRNGTTQFDTDYKVLCARSSTPLGDMNWISMQCDLRHEARVMEYDEILAMIKGESAPEPYSGQSNVSADMLCGSGGYSDNVDVDDEICF